MNPKSARPELDKLLANVRPGDAVVIWKLDRLGRSLKHLVELVGELAERKVGLQSLNDPIEPPMPKAAWCSTCSPRWPSSSAS